MHASYEGHLDCVRLLIKKGADIDAADVEGDTSLCKALLRRHLDCALFLVKSGAVVDRNTQITGFFSELVAEGRIRRCWLCRRYATRMPKCPRCERARYCNDECQAADWPSHKARCERQPLLDRSSAKPQSVPGQDALPQQSDDQAKRRRKIPKLGG